MPLQCEYCNKGISPQKQLVIVCLIVNINGYCALVSFIIFVSVPNQHRNIAMLHVPYDISVTYPVNCRSSSPDCDG